MNNTLNWEPVKNSSQIKDRAHDNQNDILYLRFINNAVYSYSPFDGKAYQDFKNALSPGKYFHAKIKDKIKHKKIS